MNECEKILRSFAYSHLQADLRKVSKPFCDLAYQLAQDLPQEETETLFALRKLLESKDCAVRAAIFARAASTGLIEDEESTPKHEVFSQPTCIFMYCPTQEVCREHGCQTEK